MSRRSLTTLVAIAAASASCVSSSGEGRSCLVTTISGDVQGVHRGSSCAFLGIPFAAPPIGDLRWKPPRPAAPWAPATLQAIAEPASCPSISPPGTNATQGSEDCLRLNIWTPDRAPASPAPVIVWLHGGAFITGSANASAHNGRRMAERTGAIVVAINYRIGPFGFLGHAALTAEDRLYPSSGNYGFLDQRAALGWVREHIAAFGGNPHNVTLAGQAAGAHSVSLHVVSPRSAGYFARAIMQSGYASTRWPTRAAAESIGDDFAVALKCTEPSQVLSCMRSRTRDEVLLAMSCGQEQLAETTRVSWGPVVDGLEIPDQPRRLYENGTFNRVPVIVGATRDEGWAYVDRSFPAGLSREVYEATVETEFGTADASGILAMYPVAGFTSPKHALAQVAGDVEAVCEARRIARLVERTHTAVYLYSFERETAAAAPDHVTHGRDTNFLFGNNFDRPTPYVLTQADLALSGVISDYWTRFAAEGNPNRDDGNGAPWPAFKHAVGEGGLAEAYIALDWPMREGTGWRGTACDFWDAFFLGSVVGSVPASQQ